MKPYTLYILNINLLQLIVLSTIFVLLENFKLVLDSYCYKSILVIFLLRSYISIFHNLKKSVFIKTLLNSN